MWVEAIGDRKHSVADVLVLLVVVCLALVTWSCLAGSSNVPLWKPYTSVTLAVLFALAALTRDPYWATTIRLLTGGWMVAAPYLLRFADVAPMAWACLAGGTLLLTVSIPGVATLRGRRASLEA